MYERGVAFMIPNGKQYKVWIVLMVISLLLVGCAPSSEVARENVSITVDTKAKPSSKPYVDHHTNKNIPTAVEDQQTPNVVIPKANDKVPPVIYKARITLFFFNSN